MDLCLTDDPRELRGIVMKEEYLPFGSYSQGIGRDRGFERLGEIYFENRKVFSNSSLSLILEKCYTPLILPSFAG